MSRAFNGPSLRRAVKFASGACTPASSAVRRAFGPCGSGGGTGTDPGKGNPSRGIARLPALDGLRALAVAAVLLYHLPVGWLPGDFSGWDVFFVISGYLITSILTSEVQRTGRIDLGAFWRRRARRLLPPCCSCWSSW